ncbi:hypothetical protein [Paraliomyxa miuraensis]|uniref:hypothetical protein n=1 Tax=Paraliomyxa miuraensis TaxID=376150 RepID=UPI00225BED9A|nr:hypothetical protein [Paraliomyxa miuraensis]MCX4244620.1 hypothetical protein [Paraliomyxa miuraensis]
MSKRLPPILGLGLGIALAAGLGGCRTIKADAPVEGAAEACCTHADFELKNFEGCRIPGRHCGGEEKFWMRGNVVCGPVDAAQCEGGRCCSYRPIYDPSLGQSVSPEDAAATQPDAPASSEPAEPAPTPPPPAEPSAPATSEPAELSPDAPSP